MVAAAEQEYHAMRDELSRLLNAVHPLLGQTGFSEVEAVTDVWLTLLQLDRSSCAFLGAVAVVQIAKAKDHKVRSPPSIEAGHPP
jgi:hypothetical protein